MGSCSSCDNPGPDTVRPARWAAVRLALSRALTVRNLLLALAVAVVVDWGLTGVRVIREDEQAVVLRFGAVNRVAPAGILFTLPWPVDRTIVVPTTEVRTMPVGYKLVDAVRGIPPSPKEVEWITGDTNIINLTVTLKYTVVDPVDYLFRVGSVEADFLVRRAAESCLVKLLATMPVDDLLTSGQIRVQEEARLKTQELLDQLEAGLRLLTVNIGVVEPPANVIEAFNDVSTAKLEKARMLNQADGYRKDLIPRARAMADRMIQEAESYRAQTVESAHGGVARFLDLLAETRKAPEITRTRLYLESMESVLPRPRKIVLDDQSGNKIRLLR